MNIVERYTTPLSIVGYSYIGLTLQKYRAIGSIGSCEQQESPMGGCGVCVKNDDSLEI
jgi:hypothetical protein